MCCLFKLVTTNPSHLRFCLPEPSQVRVFLLLPFYCNLILLLPFLLISLSSSISFLLQNRILVTYLHLLHLFPLQNPISVTMSFFTQLTSNPNLSLFHRLLSNPFFSSIARSRREWLMAWYFMARILRFIYLISFERSVSISLLQTTEVFFFLFDFLNHWN